MGDNHRGKLDVTTTLQALALIVTAEPIGEDWTLVEELPALVFDRMIRQAGWHFMWMQGACSRRGFGLTRDDAADRALTRALKGIAKRFNAAELDSVLDTKYPGFRVAHITLQPRQIQQHTSLDALADSRRYFRPHSAGKNWSRAGERADPFIFPLVLDLAEESRSQNGVSPLDPTIRCPELSGGMAMRIGDQYSSERVAPKDFEKLAEDAGLGKPLVKRRVSELAEVLLEKLPRIDAANPAAEKVASTLRRRAEAARMNYAR